MKTVTCKKCGWVHFEVSKTYVRQWCVDWNKLFKTKPKEWLEQYGVTDSPPSPDVYYHCFLCGGGYTNFRDSVPGDAPDGCTLQPILKRTAKLT